LQQAVQGELVVLFLILLAVSIRAELPAAGPPLQEGQLLAAIQTPHVPSIVPSYLILKGTLTAFYPVKHLYATFQAETLGHLNEKTLAVERPAFQIGTGSLSG
jgi:hypothetical protein